MRNYTRKKRFVKIINSWNRTLFLPGTIPLRKWVKAQKVDATESILEEIMFLIQNTTPADIPSLQATIRKKLHRHAYFYTMNGFEVYRKTLINTHNKLIKTPLYDEF